MNDSGQAIEQAKTSLIRDRGLPRHVANETALEYERLRLLRQEWPAARPEPGSLLAAFCRQVEGDAAGVGPDAAELADRYRARFADPLPYPWQRGQVALHATPAST